MVVVLTEQRSGLADPHPIPGKSPMLAGPGTIATAMNFAADSTLPEITRVLAAVGLVCPVTFAAFIGSNSLVTVLGQNVIKVVSRLMGLILAVIGVQMLIVGIRGAIEATSVQ